MHREEAEDVIYCALCRNPIAESVETAFQYSRGGCLCSSCATKRGGKYDAREERWTTAPDLEGLGSGD